MKANQRMLVIAGILLGGSASANAQQPAAPANAADTLDLTMTLMPEGATRPDAVTRIIELPAAAAEAAQENAARGLDTANEARANRGSGRDVAGEAREQGAELGQQIREQAQENRENAERGRPDSAGRPDAPGQPDAPGRPDAPPGRPDAPGRPGDLPGPPAVPPGD